MQRKFQKINFETEILTRTRRKYSINAHSDNKLKISLNMVKLAKLISNYLDISWAMHFH